MKDDEQTSFHSMSLHNLFLPLLSVGEMLCSVFVCMFLTENVREDVDAGDKRKDRRHILAKNNKDLRDTTLKQRSREK